MAKDAALFDRLEEALRDVYFVCEAPATTQTPEALCHSVLVLLERSSEAIGLQIISLSRVLADAQRPQWVKHFYSLRNPGEDKWKSLGALENYNGDDRAKMLGAIQQCVREWLNYLPDLRHPSAVSRLRDGLHQITAPFSRLCRLAHEQQRKQLQTSEPQDRQQLEFLLKAFWQDMDLAVEGLNDLDEATLQKMRHLTKDDYWEITLRNSLNAASNWLLHTRLHSATGSTTYNTTTFNRIAEGKIPDWLPLLEDLRRQLIFLNSIEQEARARIKPSRYPAVLEQYRATKQHEDKHDTHEGAKTIPAQPEDQATKPQRVKPKKKGLALARKEKEYLQAMSTLGAVSADTRQSNQDITAIMPNSENGDPADHVSMRKVRDRLVKEGLIETVSRGPAGGGFLTAKGQKKLEKLEKDSNLKRHKTGIK